MSVSRLVLVALLFGAIARADEPRDLGPPEQGPARDAAPLDPYADQQPGQPPPQSRSPHAGSPIAAALDEFDFGDYESVVQRLRPLVEDSSRALPNKADRHEALRVYGIACTLTNRPVVAEGAFLLLLREEPAMHLDPALVRPEAVAFFEEVRARHRDELLSAYHRGKPRYYYVFDILPLYGQIQNRQWKKLIGIGSAEALLLGSTILTYELLNSWQGDFHEFPHHTGAFTPLKTVNILSFALLLGVTTYGIIDGFVVGARRQAGERRQDSLLGF